MQIYTIENLEIIEQALHDRLVLLRREYLFYSETDEKRTEAKSKFDKTDELLASIHKQNNRLKYQALRDTAKSK